MDQELSDEQRSDVTLGLSRVVHGYCKIKERKNFLLSHKAEALKFQATSDHFRALLNWNKVLAHDKDGDMLAYVYNQKSLIYLEASLYKHCLNTIKLVVESQRYWNAELIERKTFCDRAIGKHGKGYGINPTKEFLKLSYDANPKMPFIVDCLKLKKNSNESRYNIITEKDLKIGDVVAIEKPFYTVSFGTDETSDAVEKDLVYQRCFHCLKDNFLDLIPCDGCEKVMFCSVKCLDNGQLMYHKYECLINGLMEGFQHAVRAMRSFFYALYLFDDKIEDLKTFIMSRGYVRKTVFDYDMRHVDTKQTRRDMLHCFDSFVAPDCQIDSSIFNLIFNTHPILSTMWHKEKDFIWSFLRRNIEITQMYAHAFFRWPGNAKEMMLVEDEDDTKEFQSIRKKVGGGVFLLMSLFNHSCVPNVHRHFNYNNKLHLIVCRDIKKGQELFISLKDCMYFCRRPTEVRKTSLLRNFAFTCTCAACNGEDFPLFQHQFIKDEKLYSLARNLDSHLESFNHKKLRKQFFYLMKLLKKNHSNFPSVELSIIQGHALTILEHTSRPTHSFY